MKWSAPLLIALFLLLGCHRDIQNKEAVRRGIMDYLAKRPDLVNMDVDVTSVAFHSNEADATVHFQAKGAPVNGGMQMRYVLERKGDAWVVKGRANSGGGPHPGIPQSQNPGLPAGHPAIPPDHPGQSQ